MPPKSSKRGADADSEPERKRTKSTATGEVETGRQFEDAGGNAYWELGGRNRRVTVSKFKDTIFVNIREYYEKDGKTLPGKKGIALNSEQWNALMSAVPQIEKALSKEGVECSRPDYDLKDETEAGYLNSEEDDDEKQPQRQSSESKISKWRATRTKYVEDE